ncbi:MAG: M48 family metallopeptidase [Lachnospiraceae bacterium]|nr:M48 family metallopeptidase [Lachnospiraceae bacterium]
MNYTTEIIKSKRKSIGFEIKEPGRLIVRVPFSMSRDRIFREMEKNRGWIDKHMLIVQEREKEREKLPKFTGEEVEKMAEEALAAIPPKVQEYAAVLGVSYGRITIRNQKSRWGSCSAKGNLNFNCLLVKVPEDVRDYVIVHELCHRMEMNHSENFWKLVESVLPDYRERRKWLKEKGNILIERL